MPAGRDKTGLDGRHWQNLDPRTLIAQRRDSITGVEAQSRDNRTYLEATLPKPENTTPQDTQTDFCRLTTLTIRGEDKKRRTFVTKITKGIGMKP